MRSCLFFCFAVLCAASAAHAQPAASESGVKRTQLGAPARALAFDQDVIVADEAGQILAVNPKALGFAPPVLAKDVSNVTLLAASGDHRWIAAATSDGTLHLISRPDGKQHRVRLGAIKKPLTRLQFAPSGRLIGWAEADTEITVWTDEGAGPIESHVLPLVQPPVAVSLYGDYVVARPKNEGLAVWDVMTQRVVRRLEEAPRALDAVAVASGNRYIAALADKTLFVWEMSTGRLLWKDAVDEKIGSLHFSADGATLYAVAESGQVTGIDVASRERKQLAQLEPPAGRLLVFDAASHSFAESVPATGGGKPGLLIADVEAAPRTAIYKEFVEEPPYVAVPLFFGTNRTVFSADSWWGQWRAYFLTAVGLGSVVIALALVFLAGLFTTRRIARWLLLLGLVTVCALASIYAQKLTTRTPIYGVQFGAGRGPLVVGQCTVTVPNSHVVGEMEAPPSFWVFKAEEDPAAHIMLQKVEPEEEAAFIAALSSRLDSTPNRDAFVFIHGYNVTFEDAARRTAQLAVDLKFKGAATFFSWPSHGDPLAYPLDAQNAEASSPSLCTFLEEMAQKAGAKRIHVIAHSMGNRILAEALKKLDKSMLARQDSPFHQVVFAAPDIDREVFLNQIAPAIVNDRQHFTLYASSQDRALMLSKAFSGAPRAGDSDPEPLVCKGIETVDASGIDTSLLGHSYYADPRALIDLFDLLAKDAVAEGRQGLAKKGSERGVYWIFKPRAVASP